MPAPTDSTLSPLILSASRATDIPACRLDWFLDTLNQGGCVWRNPFNGKTVWVSFAQARVIVFWSKNVAPLLPHLPRIEQTGLAPFFQRGWLIDSSDHNLLCF